MTTGEGLENVIRDAEMYFEKHQIRPLLTSLIVELAQRRPPDPVAALLSYLSSRSPAIVRKTEEVEAACQEGVATEASALSPAVLEAPRRELVTDGSPSPARSAPEAEEPPSGPPAAAPAEPTDAEERDEEGAAPEADPLSILLQERLPSPRGPRPAAPLAEPGLAAMRCWAGGFNRSLLEGWVKQPSPCCAAASVAGAFNALWGLGAGSEGRCTVRECADLMAEHCDALRAQRQQRLERLLGVPEGALCEFLLVLDEHLETSGLQWTARSGPKAVTKQVAMAAVREVLNSAATLDDGGRQAPPAQGEEEEDTSAKPAGQCQDVFEALREVLGVAPDAAEADGGAPEDAEEMQAEQAAGGVVLSAGTDWKKEVQELLTKRKGVMRLRAEKPNTGEIGSWGVKQAAESLALARGAEPLRVTCLLGRKNCMKGLAWPVTKADGDDAVDLQWAALKAAFSRPHTALIFHLTNHYALIFAWREWLDNGSSQERPRLRRQILTARRGQRPSAWLDFSEVRSIMLGWSGYQILQVERLGD